MTQLHYSYVGDINSNLVCSVCQEPFTDPLELPDCGHTFCRECIEEWCRQSTTCPLDHEPCSVKQAKPVGRIIKSQLGELQVKCNDCQTTLQRQAFQHHHDEECELRVLRCANSPLCAASFVRKDSAQHDAECEFRLVEHDCGVTVPVSRLEEHKRTSCQAQVSCPFAEFGCAAITHFKDLLEHMDACPYYAVRDVLRRQQDEIESLRRELGKRGPALSSSSSFQPSSAASPSRMGSQATLFGNGHEGQRHFPLLDEPEAEETWLHGFLYEYYTGDFDRVPDFDKLECKAAGVLLHLEVDHTTEMETLDINRSCANPLDSGNFAARFRGYINIRQPGKYSFYLSSNDGSYLMIDGKRVVDNDGSHYAQTKECKISLEEGKYKFEIGYFHRNGKVLEGLRGGPSLQLQYYTPGPAWPLNIGSIPRQHVPDSAFFHRPEEFQSLSVVTQKGAVDAPYTKTNTRTTLDVEKFNDMQMRLVMAETKVQALEQEIYEARKTATTQQEAMKAQLVEAERDTEDVFATLAVHDPFSHPAQDGQGSSSASSKSTARLQPFLANVDDLKRLYFSVLYLSLRLSSDTLSVGTNVDIDELREQVMQSPVQRWPRQLLQQLKKSSIASDPSL